MALRLIIGDDPILIGEAVTAAVDELVGDGDRSLMLETLTEADYRNDDGDWESAKVLDAARTPPFLTERRVVVGRITAEHGGRVVVDRRMPQDRRRLVAVVVAVDRRMT